MSWVSPVRLAVATWSDWEPLSLCHGLSHWMLRLSSSMSFCACCVDYNQLMSATVCRRRLERGWSRYCLLICYVDVCSESVIPGSLYSLPLTFRGLTVIA